VLAAWESAPPIFRGAAAASAGMVVPLLLHLVARSLGRGRLVRSRRILLAVAYGAGIATLLVRAFVTDPFLDASCWVDCMSNPFLVRALPRLSSDVQDGARLLSVVLAVGLLALGAVWLSRATPDSRPLLLATAVPGCVTFAAMAAGGVEFLLDPTRDPAGVALTDAYVVSAVALTALAGGLLATTSHLRQQRRAVGTLAARLGHAPSPAHLESALARSTGDATLRIAFRLAETDEYVDAAGRPVPPPVAAYGRAVTELTRDDVPIATLEHAAELTHVERAMGPALTLSVENAGIQAALTAQIDQLRATRQRIVVASDAERRRLERDLHDGAQQQLLALALDLRLASATASRGAANSFATLLTRAADEARVAVAELRELAHGLYPAALAESGLVAALDTLAARAPVAVELRAVPGGRHPVMVEAVAYALVADAVDDAVTRAASYLTVEVHQQGDLLVVETADDGSARESPMTAVVNRVGALGGHVLVGTSTLRGDLPCVW